MQQFPWKLIFSFLILCLAGPCMAENQMELIWNVEGEHITSWYGDHIASIDFNDDGYDDLVVGSERWSGEYSAHLENWGKVYFYWGGPDFDEIPDLTMQGDSTRKAMGSLLDNIGDVNGDGVEDLVTVRRLYLAEYHYDYLLEIYYGGSNCDTMPDYEQVFENSVYDCVPVPHSLGDINGDGYDEVGITCRYCESSGASYSVFILFGGDSLSLTHWGDWGDDCGFTFLSGVGDVNADGYDDFTLKYTPTSPMIGVCRFYYGGAIIDSTDYVLLGDSLNTYFSGLSCGDMNADGYGDFIGCFGNWLVINKLWFGCEQITPQWDMEIEGYIIGSSFDWGFDHGDLNGDGYSDIVGGKPYHHGEDGSFFVYLGGESVNNRLDCRIDAPDILVRMADPLTVGDFNGDGYDDVAAGASGDYPDRCPGQVFVYAGNPELTDLVAAENAVPTPQVPSLQLNVYPNPFNPELHFHVEGQVDSDLQVQIFNVKGQLVETIHPIEADFVWHAGSFASGIYLCKLMHQQRVMDVQKVTLLK